MFSDAIDTGYDQDDHVDDEPSYAYTLLLDHIYQGPFADLVFAIVLLCQLLCLLLCLPAHME